MNLIEYQTIKDLNYLQYCDYLQNKYGIAVCNYMTATWTKNRKCTRTAEGLFIHHKYEDHAQKLCDPNEAKDYPYEWQKADNLVYCDYLEHLLLHILICEQSLKNGFRLVGIGGIFQYMLPELNDVYSGWKTNQEWRKNCHTIILKDKDVYLLLLKRFKTNCHTHPFFLSELLTSSYNQHSPSWDIKNNQALFDEIKAL